jgi:HSP20 family molecular chaperone IbpA
LGISGKKQENVAKSESYTPEFLELERKKRYGFVNQMEETENTYTIKVFFPTLVPPSEIGDKLGIPAEMPDYSHDVKLDDGRLTVKGRLTDENVLKLTGILNSFPDRFYKEFVFGKPVSRFEISYSNKVLDIVVFKESVSDS